MSSQYAKNTNERQLVDIGYYFKLIKANALSVLMFAALISAITLMILLSVTPVYRATATLLIEASQKKAVSIEEVVGIDTSAKEYYLTQFEILKSNKIALKVIETLELDRLPEFNPQLEDTTPSFFENLSLKLSEIPLIKAVIPGKSSSAETAEHELVTRTVLENFSQRLTISPIKKTQLVRISFDSRDPELAARVANAVGNAYIENNLESKLIATEQASSWINVRLAELKQKLSESEQALLEFLEREQLIEDSGIVALASSELNNLTSRLAQATDRRIQAQSLYSAISSNKSKDLATLSSVAAISNHPQITSIRMAEVEAEKKVSELSRRYGAKHDKMIQAKAQLEAIQDRADKLINKLFVGIGKELESARQQEALIRSELESKKDEFQKLSVVKREYDALKREVDTNSKLYDLFLTRKKETSATSDYDATNATFSDHALVPYEPVKPDKKTLLLVAFMSSITFAIAVVFIRDALDNTIESSRDFEDKFGLIPLGAIPKIKDKAYRKAPVGAEAYLRGDQGIYQESVDSIRTSLMLMLMNKSRKLIAITSSMKGEGKTTTAVGLALSFSRMEKVLLVDCDLRKSSVAERFGLPRNHPGVTNILLQGSEPGDCLTTIEGSGLTVLCAGMVSPDVQETLSSQAFEQLMETLSGQFDRIIIDTPPVLPVTDSLIIGKYTGSLIMVMKANSTSRTQYLQAVSGISKHDIALDGVIISQIGEKSRAGEKYQEYARYAYN